jgi:sec-independent protein translocase protein TatC
MTVVEHLEELRRCLIISLLAVLAGTVVAYIVYKPILAFLLHPVISKQVPQVYYSGIVTGFLIRVKVSMFVGVVMALPVILWQIWRFVTPGLEPNEKRYAIPFVVSSLGLFALGTFFAFLILPVGIKWLLTFTIGPHTGPFIFVDQYLSFLMFMILAFGVSFEFPLLLVFLAGVGVLSSAKLRRYRRHAILGTAIVAAVATPSQDPYSMVVMWVPLYILYEISILVIRRAMKK